ncbi:uncharacterized protein LOC135220574 [Macrobrachium nipponense]|uniref:uncharacterized protein LOC135220574 n=1 Tax=Macrobrachium nipponense TaxID=159736 RepID=UPI0030C83237
MEADFQLYEVWESSGTRHSILKVPNSLPAHYGSEAAKATSDVYNILMADISGSMYSFWPHIVTGWQASIKDKLTGRTEIYAFGDEIKLKRVGTELTESDFTSDGTNDLTGALRTVRHKVENCSESVVRVFIIADGAHDHGEPYPETEINQMKPLRGKTVSVYILGLGYDFPVQHSIDIRSRMHSGNANIPYLFWAKNDDDIEDQLAAIGSELDGSVVKLKLDLEGSVLPGLEKTSVIHLGEWLYFEATPEELPPVFLTVNDEPPRLLTLKASPVNVRLLLDGVFRQWNSLIIQQHRRKEHVPLETFDLMESCFKYFWDTLKKDIPDQMDIKSRITRKKVKATELEFRTLMNQSKSLIDLERKFKNELELAETILKSTVTNRKYDLRNLKLKGYSLDDFEEDMKSFREIFEEIKMDIMKLPTPQPEDCCCITITSTVGDLQDPDFHLVMEESKFDFLKSFTITGIPVYAPIRDSSQINPWTMVIKHILVTPFALLSHLVLEESAALDDGNLGKEDKEVTLQQDNEHSKFNAIIPVLPVEAAQVLKPIVLSNIYAMMSTFCIFKNPHIVDYSAHIAALGCAWIKTVTEFPINSRPEFARNRLENIVATAKLYMDRPSIKTYVRAMVSQPKQALMTESTELYDSRILKCESLVKPAFFAYLSKDMFSQQQLISFYKLLQLEFLGRCLSSYDINNKAATPFTDFFCPQLSDKKEKTEWLQKHAKIIVEKFQETQGNLLERFFTLDELIPCVKKFVTKEVVTVVNNLLDHVSVKVNMEKVKRQKNPSSCGDILWSSLQAWALEMDIPADAIEECCSSFSVQVYVSESLQFRSSRKRLQREMPEVDDALKNIETKILQENGCVLRRVIFEEARNLAIKHWREAYLNAHRPLVMPLTKQEIMEAAQARGIQVTKETFDKVYRYNDNLQLLRNACQIQDCPHYLQPHNNFNQHLSIEREHGNFPHALHLVSREFCHGDVKGVIEKVVSGEHAGTRNRKSPILPELHSLDYLQDEIKELLKAYFIISE